MACEGGKRACDSRTMGHSAILLQVGLSPNNNTSHNHNNDNNKNNNNNNNSSNNNRNNNNNNGMGPGQDPKPSTLLRVGREAICRRGKLLFTSGPESSSQRLQYHLIKEKALNYSRIPNMIEGLVLN